MVLQDKWLSVESGSFLPISPDFFRSDLAEIH